MKIKTIPATHRVMTNNGVKPAPTFRATCESSEVCDFKSRSAASWWNEMDTMSNEWHARMLTLES